MVRALEINQHLDDLVDDGWWSVMTSPAPSIRYVIAASAADNSVKNLPDPKAEARWLLTEVLWIDE